MYKDKKSPPMALPTLVYRYVRCSSVALLEIATRWVVLTSIGRHSEQ